LAKKPVVKKARMRRGNGPMQTIAPPYVEKKSVRITEADNGFTVCAYGGNGGPKEMVAKSEGEAMRHAKALLGGKK
jgi:hypothetical protein